MITIIFICVMWIVWILGKARGRHQAKFSLKEIIKENKKGGEKIL